MPTHSDGTEAVHSLSPTTRLGWPQRMTSAGDGSHAGRA